MIEKMNTADSLVQADATTSVPYDAARAAGTMKVSRRRIIVRQGHETGDNRWEAKIRHADTSKPRSVSTPKQQALMEAFFIFDLKNN